MEELIGKFVKILLIENVALEGIVKNYYDNKIELQPLDDNSLSIIFNVDKNIKLIKIFPNENKKDIKTAVNEVQIKFKENIDSIPSKDSLKLNKMIELKKQLIQEEKEILNNKLKDHNISDVRRTVYAKPGFFFKK